MDIKEFVLSYYSNATESFHIKEITEPHEALSLHSHGYYQIYYLKSGRLIHHLENACAELVARDVFIIPPNLPHYVEKASSEVCFYSISFMPEYIAEIVVYSKTYSIALERSSNQELHAQIAYLFFLSCF